MAKINIQELKQRYGIVGRDEKLDNALDTALQVAMTDLSVLIQGESGVGKEVLPRIIHDNSLRKSKRYIAINCGSIPQGTIDSELFGHEKGAFTGAISDHEGYFGAANGGTLFLDEVGELPLSTQVRLLRVLETGEYVRVGSNEPRKTDVRIVAATNVKMEQAIREGRFREDLYYRLCTISIKMPALRERGADSVLLFKKFAMDTARRYNIPEPLRLTPDAEQVVMSYKWPGNVRQLKNVAEQMSILLKEERLVTPEILSRFEVYPNGGETGVTLVHPINQESFYDYQQERQILFEAIRKMHEEVRQLNEEVRQLREDRPSVASSTGISRVGFDNSSHELAPAVSAPVTAELSRPAYDVHRYEAPVNHSTLHADADAELVEEEEELNLEKNERKSILKALQRNHGRRKNAARDLGISDRTLYRKIEQYGITEADW